ncbi:MAG: SurA N-terminal domain-containing protein [Burkholderiales bacterium]
MFDFIHGNKKIVQIILILIALTFAFWGVESYQMAGLGADVASVEGQKISQQEFTNALRDQQEAMRQQYGGNADASLLDSPEMRRAVLQGLIETRLQGAQAREAGLVVSDAELAKAIGDLKVFHEDGKFSRNRYELLLRNQGMTPVVFENRLRQDLAREQLRAGLSETAFYSGTVLDRLIKISQEQREVSFLTFSPADFIAQVKLEPEAAQNYYEANRDEFRIPEQAKVEYVVLSADTLAPKMEVTDDEIKKHYEENKAKYLGAEEREASHILIKGDDEKARAKGEELAEEARKNPDAFGKLAKEHSQDPGSAAKNGELGYFRKGVMAKPFEEAVFDMQLGEIKGPIKTDFGLHVVRLTGIKPGVERKFDEVKASIEQELKKQKASRKFAELAENFSNMVYEQPDSLKPAAEAFDLKVEQSDWVKRGGENPGVLGHAKLQDAVFSTDAVKEKRNTEVVEAAPATLVSARIVDYQAPSLKPLEEVKSEITAKLLLAEADKRAEEEAQAVLAKLREGGDVKREWRETKTVSRRDTGELEGSVLKQIFKANVEKLPAYTGADVGDEGYRLIKITSVQDSGKPDESKRAALVNELTKLKGEAQLSAYLQSFRSEAEIRVKEENLEKQ